MTDDTDAVARLIRAAGRRAEPSPEAMLRMRAALHAEWQQGLRRRARQRLFAIAASVLLVVAGGLLVASRTSPGLPGGGALVASVAGPAAGLAIDTGWRGWLRAAGPAGDVFPGDVVTTRAGADTTVLRLPDERTVLRLAASTRLSWTAPGQLRLLSGRVYVDTGAGAGGRAAAPLRIPAGDAVVEHVDTRFVTATDGATVDVVVRDGQVRITTAGQIADLARGERARLAATGTLVKAAGAAAGAEWDWVDAAAPRIALDNQDLLSVLRLLSFEAGIELVFVDAAAESRAGATILHGPPVDLPPRAAIQAILATTSFTARDSTRPDRLVLELRER
jgi:hypothetical protein